MSCQAWPASHPADSLPQTKGGPQGGKRQLSFAKKGQKSKIHPSGWRKGTSVSASRAPPPLLPLGLHPSALPPTSPLLLSACCCSRPVAEWLAERMSDAGTKMQVKIFETIPLKAASSIDGERIGWASARHCLCMLRSSAWNLLHNHMPVG